MFELAKKENTMHQYAYVIPGHRVPKAVSLLRALFQSDPVDEQEMFIGNHTEKWCIENMERNGWYETQDEYTVRFLKTPIKSST